jgi:large subunit ribosomal protein L9
MAGLKGQEDAGARRGVELLLAENVANLGRQGDIVRVKPGYARNFLLPQGLATVATDSNKRMVESHRQRQAQAAAKKLDEFRKLANKLADYPVTMEANANDEGHLYGSVVAVDISRELKKASFDVEPEQIVLEGPLKELGMYTVQLQLHPEVPAEVKVWVVPAAKG